jgi:hypothetical protein
MHRAGDVRIENVPDAHLIESIYAASCPGATIGEGLAVRGEEVVDAGDSFASWLQRIDLINK